jgi:uncharacterized protein (TIGR03118 family)
MKVIRLLPLGLLVAGGLGVGCGNAPDTSSTTADLQMSKSTPFESIVTQDNLVSNIPIPGDKDVKLDPADPKDPFSGLLNAWGLVFADSGFAWVNANHSGTDRVYDNKGNLRGVVKYPLTDAQKEAQKQTPDMPVIPAPTGQVVNGFPKSFDHDNFITVSEDGVVFGIDVKGMKKNMVNAEAFIRYPVNGVRDTHAEPPVYKGVAQSTFKGKPALFAADFHNGGIDVFDADYEIVVTDGFQNAHVPAGYAPFNILAANGRLIVTYALQNDERADDVAGPGHGFVDVFETNGTFVTQLISGDKHPEVNSPWGMALSAENTEKNSVDLILGNFGDGHVNVYELTMQGKNLRATFEGQLGVVGKDKKTSPLVISGLWGLVFGNDKGGFEAADLYFTAGPDNGPGTELEQNGLFGELSFASPRR